MITDRETPAFCLFSNNLPIITYFIYMENIFVLWCNCFIKLWYKVIQMDSSVILQYCEGGGGVLKAQVDIQVNTIFKIFVI